MNNESGQQYTERNAYIDLLRVISAFGVIVIHVAALKWYDTPVGTFNWQAINFYHTIIRWPVPVFVMISGIFALRPLNENTGFKSEIKKILYKVLRLVLAIIFWAFFCNTVYLFINHFVKGESIAIYDFLRIPGLIILGRAWYHLWFLYMMIGLYLLTPIFRIFIKNGPRKYLEYFLILFFLLGTCLPFINVMMYTYRFSKDKE
jgi:surface polysaccharide O-acyltransferase-like enzyme